MIDLRSDTVTQPTPAMREAMAAAPVGDDQFGEDPSVNLLQERVAELLGKDAALWVPTGTMANQVALRILTRPGDDVIVSDGAHVVWSETGAGGANAGVQFTALGGGRGFFTSEELGEAIKPSGHVILPPTTLVSVENTHNRAGGVVVPLEVLRAVGQVGREAEVASYLDGARIWNAAVASGHSPAELSAPFDLVWVAFSKGLGAPGGSMLAGPRHLITRAHRYRRMLGGAMRQVGVLAAAASHALDHHRGDIAADHQNASEIARILGGSDAVEVAPVQTNIILFRPRADPATVVERAAESGVGVFAFGPFIRAVTHRDLTSTECTQAARLLADAAEA
ncbi:GntG family PLP-dependent aldolase [soil metagenome]